MIAVKIVFIRFFGWGAQNECVCVWRQLPLGIYVPRSYVTAAVRRIYQYRPNSSSIVNKQQSTADSRPNSPAKGLSTLATKVAENGDNLSKVHEY